MLIETVKTGKDIADLVEDIVGEDRFCEKNLLTATLYLQKYYCSASKQNLITTIDLLYKLETSGKSSYSELDKIFDELEVMDPNNNATKYFKAFKMYPDHSRGQAVGNLIFKLLNEIDNNDSCKVTQEVRLNSLQYQLQGHYRYLQEIKNGKVVFSATSENEYKTYLYIQFEAIASYCLIESAILKEKAYQIISQQELSAIEANLIAIGDKLKESLPELRKHKSVYARDAERAIARIDSRDWQKTISYFI